MQLQCHQDLFDTCTENREIIPISLIHNFSHFFYILHKILPKFYHFIEFILSVNVFLMFYMPVFQKNSQIPVHTYVVNDNHKA